MIPQICNQPWARILFPQQVQTKMDENEIFARIIFFNYTTEFDNYNRIYVNIIHNIPHNMCHTAALGSWLEFLQLALLDSRS